MALIDEVKQICDRLAPLGWRDLLIEATANGLDIAQPTSAKLRAAVTSALPTIDRTLPGVRGFPGRCESRHYSERTRASLLYHALESPRVLRDGAGAVLRGFPMMAVVETVENFVFGIRPPNLGAFALSLIR